VYQPSLNGPIPYMCVCMYPLGSKLVSHVQLGLSTSMNGERATSDWPILVSAYVVTGRGQISVCTGLAAETMRQERRGEERIAADPCVSGCPACTGQECSCSVEERLLTGCRTCAGCGVATKDSVVEHSNLDRMRKAERSRQFSTYKHNITPLR
jgi:hypothetical protein